MTLKIYTYPNNYRVWKAQIAAKYNNVHIEIVNVDIAKDTKTEAFLKKNPMGKVPVLETTNGSIFESNAIARYVARLNNSSNLMGHGFHQKGQVDQWIDFTTTEIQTNMGTWLYPILGYTKYDAGATETAKTNIHRAMGALNSYLAQHTFLVGEAITLADITLACPMVHLFTFFFDAAWRKKYINVYRWFNTCVHQPEFASVIGNVKYAETEAKYGQKINTPKKPASPNQRVSPKKAASPKKTASPKKSPIKKAASPVKKSPAKKSPAKSPKKSPVKAAGKPKNPLDTLPASTMVLDAVKKMYYAAKTPADFFTELWEIFDAEGYCFYEAEYQYNDENTVYFMTCNLVGGYIQRLDSLRKYGFGCLNITGDEEVGPWTLSGIWLFRGTSIPFEMKDCPDSEYYKWIKLNPKIPSQRQRIETLWGADMIDGKAVQERRFFQ